MFNLFGKKKEVLDSINGIVLTREDNIKLGDVVHDYSPMHRDPEIARKFGFKDTPVIGVHSAAIGSRMARDLVRVTQRPSENLIPISQGITFRDAIYPGEPINWDPEHEVDEEGRREYRLCVPSNIAGKKPRVDLTVIFGTKYNLPILPDGDRFVFEEEIEITPKEVKEFYECLREEPQKEVLFSHQVGRNTSALLSLNSKLNELCGTEVGGRNISMESLLYAPGNVGLGRIKVYELEISGRGKNRFYTFDTWFYQGENPILSSKIKVLADGDLDIYALRPKPAEPARVDIQETLTSAL